MQEETTQLVQQLLSFHPGDIRHLIFMFVFINVIIPLLLQFKRNRKFDTRPLEIVFNGFMFGVVGTGATLFICIFKGFWGPFYCKVVVNLDFFDHVRSAVIILIFMVINLNTVGVILDKLGGTLTWRTMTEHLLVISTMHYYAPLLLDERAAPYYFTEMVLYTLFTAKKVMECTSSEIRESIEGQLITMEQIYSIGRLLQAVSLIGHGYYQIKFNCPMSVEAAQVQIVYGVLFLILWTLTGRKCLQRSTPKRSKRD